MIIPNLKSLMLFAVLITLFHICRAQNGMWTWVGGSKNAGDMGNYGVKNVANAANIPPVRYQVKSRGRVAGTGKLSIQY